MFWKTVFYASILLALCLISNASIANGQAGPGPVEGGGQMTATAGIPGGPGYVMVPATAFIPRDNTTLFSRANGVILTTKTGSVFYTYDAPVYLPDGATVTKLILYYQDTDVSKNIQIDLWYGPLPGNTGQSMANVVSDNQSNMNPVYKETTTFLYSQVSNQANAYYIKLTLPPPSNASVYLNLNGVRIDYQYSANLPAVMR